MRKQIHLKYQQHKRLIHNFIFLAINQAIEMFIPLITFRFLIETIGVEKFGLLNFVMAFLIYFQILIDYGFNNSATRQISLFENHKNRLNIIVNRVISAKIYLLLISFILFVSLIFSIPSFRENYIIYILYFGVVIGYAFSPTWFFQGLQNMKMYIIINAIFKIIALVIIIISISNEEEYWIAPLVFSCSYIIIALFTTFKLFNDNKFSFRLISPKKVKDELNEGKFFFLSELQATLFTNTNVLILGIVSSLTNVAYFTSADKLSRSIRNIQIPLSNALYPYLTKQINRDPLIGLKIINKITLLGVCVLSITSIIIGILGKQIIILLFSEEMESATIIFQILLLIPIFSFIDNMYGKQVLLNLKKDKLFFRIFLTSSIICLTLSLCLTYFFSLIGTAIAVAIGQGFLALNMFYFAQKAIYEKNKN